jgi:hypothetical protein
MRLIFVPFGPGPSGHAPVEIRFLSSFEPSPLRRQALLGTALALPQSRAVAGCTSSIPAEVRHSPHRVFPRSKSDAFLIPLSPISPRAYAVRVSSSFFIFHFSPLTFHSLPKSRAPRLVSHRLRPHPSNAFSIFHLPSRPFPFPPPAPYAVPPPRSRDCARLRDHSRPLSFPLSTSIYQKSTKASRHSAALVS